MGSVNGLGSNYGNAIPPQQGAVDSSQAQQLQDPSAGAQGIDPRLLNELLKSAQQPAPNPASGLPAAYPADAQGVSAFSQQALVDAAQLQGAGAYSQADAAAMAQLQSRSGDAIFGAPQHRDPAAAAAAAQGLDPRLLNQGVSGEQMASNPAAGLEAINNLVDSQGISALSDPAAVGAPQARSGDPRALLAAQQAQAQTGAADYSQAASDAQSASQDPALASQAPGQSPTGASDLRKTFLYSRLINRLSHNAAFGGKIPTLAESLRQFPGIKRLGLTETVAKQLEANGAVARAAKAAAFAGGAAPKGAIGSAVFKAANLVKDPVNSYNVAKNGGSFVKTASGMRLRGENGRLFSAKAVAGVNTESRASKTAAKIGKAINDAKKAHSGGLFGKVFGGIKKAASSATSAVKSAGGKLGAVVSKLPGGAKLLEGIKGVGKFVGRAAPILSVGFAIYDTVKAGSILLNPNSSWKKKLLALGAAGTSIAGAFPGAGLLTAGAAVSLSVARDNTN